MALDVLPEPQHKRKSVQVMFDRIAPRYDAMNRLMSLGLDRRWRREAITSLALEPGARVLDLACGTGDLAELVHAAGARVVGLDFAREMLRGAHARRRVASAGTNTASWVQGDASALPLADGGCDALVCGFALRNFVSLGSVFAEGARVLKPGARIALLDVDRPRQGWVRLGHELYFDRFVPRLGAWLSDREAYAYLPRSTAYLPDAPTLKAGIEAAGFEAVKHRSLFFGAVQLWTARRSGSETTP